MHTLCIALLLFQVTGRVHERNPAANDLGACIYFALLLEDPNAPSLGELAARYPLFHAKSGSLEDALIVLLECGFHATVSENLQGKLPAPIGITIAILDQDQFCVIHRTSPSDGYVFIPGNTPINFLAFDASRIQGPAITQSATSTEGRAMTFWGTCFICFILVAAIAFRVLRHNVQS